MATVRNRLVRLLRGEQRRELTGESSTLNLRDRVRSVEAVDDFISVYVDADRQVPVAQFPDGTKRIIPWVDFARLAMRGPRVVAGVHDLDPGQQCGLYSHGTIGRSAGIWPLPPVTPGVTEEYTDYFEPHTSWRQYPLATPPQVDNDAPVRVRMRQGESPALIQGLAAMTCDPLLATAGVGGAYAGDVIHNRLDVEYTRQVSTIHYWLETSGVTVADAFLGIYDSAFNQIALTADIASALNGATGQKSSALSTPVTLVAGRRYYVSVLYGSAGTDPLFLGTIAAPVLNTVLTTDKRAGRVSGSATALPATSVSGAPLTQLCWFGVA